MEGKAEVKIWREQNWARKGNVTKRKDRAREGAVVRREREVKVYMTDNFFLLD